MIGPALVAAALFGLFVLLLLLEQVTPLRGHRRDLFGRLLINLAMSAVALATAMLLVRPAALAALQWASDRSFGVVRTVTLPPAVQFAQSFLLMDLTF